MTEQEQIDRGQRAERLLQDALYVESFELVRKAIVTKWEQSPGRDAEGREYLFLMLKALNDAKGALEQAVSDGKVTLHSQEQKRLFKMFR
jgi:hypothetical protein